MKIYFVVAELFYADEQTDMKRIVAFRNFANEPKTYSISLFSPSSVFVAVKQHMQTAYGVQSPLLVRYKSNTDDLTCKA